MPNVGGILSFLQTPPEEYVKRLVEQVKETPEPPAQQLQQPIDKPAVSDQLSDSKLLPVSNLPPDSNLLPDSDLQSVGSSLPPRDSQGNAAAPPEPEPVSNLLPDSNQQPGSRLLSGGELQTSRGRIVRIRLARSVQDAHTSGEHMLLQMMWKRGTSETDGSRQLKAGLSELARWTGAHKTSCRDYLRALIQKLALEEITTFNAAAGLDGARVYRIYSFNAILERRQRAGFTHVIRTGSVNFVDAKTGAKLTKPLPDSNLLPGGNLPTGSNLLPESNLPPESGSSQDTRPGSNQHRINNKDKRITSSSLVEAGTRAGLDDDAVRRIVSGCRAYTPDATDDEIAFFLEKDWLRLRDNPQVKNLPGLLVIQVPKNFQPGPLFDGFRRRRQEEAEANAQRGRELEESLREAAAEDEAVKATDRAWEDLTEAERNQRKEQFRETTKQYRQMTDQQRDQMAEHLAKQNLRQERQRS
jgi:hypothetical protein